MNTPTMADSRIGPLNALANYWLTRLQYEETKEPKAVPEYNLEIGGASVAFFNFVEMRSNYDKANLSSTGFDIGFELALALKPDAFKTASGVKAIGDRDFATVGFQVGFAFALILERDPLNAGPELLGVLNDFLPPAKPKTGDVK